MDNEVIETHALGILNKSEIDQQVATAKQYPRDVSEALKNCSQLIAIESVAESCIYSLQRKDKGGNVKAIEGPSTRFAEILASQWGNCRVQARVVAEDDKFVTAQGVFHDLQKNTAILKEVKRRITSKRKDGTSFKFSDDMIAVTSNAASSIAMRNAITAGIPKAIWQHIYDQAKQVIAGTGADLPQRIERAFEYFCELNVTDQQLLDYLGLKDRSQINKNHLVTLHGVANNINDGFSDPEKLFTKETPKESEVKNVVAEMLKQETYVAGVTPDIPQDTPNDSQGINEPVQNNRTSDPEYAINETDKKKTVDNSGEITIIGLSGQQTITRPNLEDIKNQADVTQDQSFDIIKQNAIKFFKNNGIGVRKLNAYLGYSRQDDWKDDDIAVLREIAGAIKSGKKTIAQVFGEPKKTELPPLSPDHPEFKEMDNA